jgi:hypothetical protein
MAPPIKSINGLPISASNADSALTSISASYATTAQTILGTVTSASYALTASVSIISEVTNDTTTNASFFPTFVSATSGYQTLKVDSNTLTWNPSTNTLTALNFAGNATTATNATSATSASYALNSTTASNARTASFVNTLNQSVTVSGSILSNTTNQTLGQFVGNQNGYAEFSVRNTNTGASASGDFAVYADTGTVLNNYIDMGINNSGLNPAYFYGGTDFGNALDAYVYNVGGNLRIGNATSAAPYSQSFYLFSNPQANPNITITGSQVAINKTGSLNGVFDISGSTVITGSQLGNVISASVVSGTASLDLNAGNFFYVQLLNSSTTHINPTNIKAGQTIGIRIQQAAGSAGAVSWPTSIKQPSGSAYTASTALSSYDIVSLISFDTSNLYLSYVKRLI